MWHVFDKLFVCLWIYISGFLFVGCSSDFTPAPSPLETPATSRNSPDRFWIVAPPLKGDEYGDWYFLRARVTSHDILFYQLCLRDRRTGEDGWAFYEETLDEENRTYPTVVLNRKINQKAVMKELLGIMLTREDLERAERKDLILHIKGQFDTMSVRIQAAYAKGFLSLVDEYFDRPPSTVDSLE